MNPYFIILKKGHIKFLSQRKAMRENFTLSVYTTYLLTMFLIAFLGIYYVWNLNNNATKGYELSNIENKNMQLIIEKEQYDIKIAQFQSISHIQTWEGIKIMESIENPQYIVIEQNKEYALLKK